MCYINTIRKNIEKGKKPTTSANSPTLMTADSYAMGSGFTLVTRSRAKAATKKNGRLLLLEAFCLFNTAICRHSFETYCLSPTSKGPSVSSTYLDAVDSLIFGIELLALSCWVLDFFKIFPLILLSCVAIVDKILFE